MMSFRIPLRPLLTEAIFALILLLVPMVSWAMPILTPTGLNPGDTYHLVFVTSTTRSALKTDITVYDAFVQNAANDANIGLGSTLGLGDISWKAIGSTAAVDAIDHIGVSGAVYRLDGVLVATGEADLFDGTIAAPIVLSETLTSQAFSLVFTGSDSAGLGIAGREFGELGGGLDPNVGAGLTQVTDGRWLDAGGSTATAAQHIYGISEALVAPEPIPEPATLTLFGTGMLGLMGWSWRRRRR